MMSIAAGISLFLVSALILTRMTLVDPLVSLFGVRGAFSDAVAYLYFVLVVGVWSSALKSIRVGDAALVFSTCGICVTAAEVVPAVLGTSEEDVVRLCIGWHAWWMLIPLTVGAWWAKPGSATLIRRAWYGWWTVGGGAWGVGLAVYASGSFFSVPGMIAKTALILVVPSVVLMHTALVLRGAGKTAWVRAMGAIGVLVAAAVATVR